MVSFVAHLAMKDTSPSAYETWDDPETQASAPGVVPHYALLIQALLRKVDGQSLTGIVIHRSPLSWWTLT